jgi:hypothetical protein
MKFDKLIYSFLDEAVKSQITGYVHKSADRNINPDEKISSFLSSKNPTDLIDAITFARDHVKVPIKVGKKTLMGDAFVDAVKSELFEIFELKKGSSVPKGAKKILVPIEEYKDKSSGEVKLGIAGTQAAYFGNKFFPMNPSLLNKDQMALIGAWYKLVNLLYPEYERPSDIRQEGSDRDKDTRKVTFEYKDAYGNTVQSWITVRNNDDTITGDPLSSPAFYTKKLPKATKNLNYRQFKELAGGTLDNLITAINGRIVNDPKKP